MVGIFALRGEVKGNETHLNLVPPHEKVDLEPTTAAPVIGKSELERVVAAALTDPQRLKPLAPTAVDDETLWLARCIYSETKRPEEQELVAWVVRNRVETGYRGKRSYRDVVLDPYQFSAFNPNSRKASHYKSLGVNSSATGWQHALNIAYHVRFADSALRPFPDETRHFYSERSMPSHDRHPDWAEGLEPVKPMRPVKLEVKRFRFFEGIN